MSNPGDIIFLQKITRSNGTLMARQVERLGVHYGKTAGARGFGNTRQLKSGKHQVRYTDPNGNPQKGRVTFSTKREAEKELSRIRLAIETGTWHIDETPRRASLTLKPLPWSNLQRLGANKPLTPRADGLRQRP